MKFSGREQSDAKLRPGCAAMLCRLCCLHQASMRHVREAKTRWKAVLRQTSRLWGSLPASTCPLAFCGWSMAPSGERTGMMRMCDLKGVQGKDALASSEEGQFACQVWRE